MSYHSSWLVKHFHFLLCDPIKIAGCKAACKHPRTELTFICNVIYHIFHFCPIFNSWFLYKLNFNWQLEPCCWKDRAGFSGVLWESSFVFSHRGAVWVCWVRGFLFFWRMVPFPQPSPAEVRGVLVTTWQGQVTLVVGGLWNLAPVLRWSVLVSRGINVPLQALLGRSRLNSGFSVHLTYSAVASYLLWLQIKVISERLLLHFM